MASNYGYGYTKDDEPVKTDEGLWDAARKSAGDDASALWKTYKDLWEKKYGAVLYSADKETRKAIAEGRTNAGTSGFTLERAGAPIVDRGEPINLEARQAPSTPFGGEIDLATRHAPSESVKESEETSQSKAVDKETKRAEPRASLDVEVEADKRSQAEKELVKPLEVDAYGYMRLFEATGEGDPRSAVPSVLEEFAKTYAPRFGITAQELEKATVLQRTQFARKTIAERTDYYEKYPDSGYAGIYEALGIASRD